MPIHPGDMPQEPEPPPDLRARTAFDDVIDNDAIGRGFDRMRPQDRMILVLHHVEERPIAEIARSLGNPGRNRQVAAACRPRRAREGDGGRVMNASRLTEGQISQALRAHLPERAQAGLRERILEAAETTSQQRALPSFLGALSDADPVSRRRSLLIAAALLVALALAATAAVGALRLLERDPFQDLSLEPPTVPSPATLPGRVRWTLDPPTAETPSAQVADRYQALVVRHDADGTKIVAVRGDRQERIIVTFSPTERQEVGFNLVSADGWLVMAYRDGMEFVDLRDPSRSPRPFSMADGTTGFAWNPDGRFGSWTESGRGHPHRPRNGRGDAIHGAGPRCTTFSDGRPTDRHCSLAAKAEIRSTPRASVSPIRRGA